MAPSKSLVLTALLVLVAAAAQVPRGTEAARTPGALISGIVRCNDRSSTDLSAVPGEYDDLYICSSHAEN
jgi:hypothetical protein